MRSRIIGAGVAAITLMAATAPQPESPAQALQEPATSAAITPQQIARGDSIFRGKLAGGLCFTCHQLNAKGLPGLAPDLTDMKWLHGDGSYEFIVANIIKGVPKPKQASAPMPPRGGASMSDADVRAVAAYVYSLSRPKK